MTPEADDTTSVHADPVHGVALGDAVVERSSAHLLAVDAENAVVAKAVADFPRGHEDRRQPMDETGRTT